MPADEASALRAVLTAPAADEPRRAYAERLAASARPADRARAEFIRLQLELETLPGADPRWPTLVARERELLDRHRAAWEKPLRDLFRPPLASPGRWLRSHLFGSGGLWAFHRGFVEHILAPAPTFLSEDVALLGRAPIRRVVLAHASEHVGELARDARLESLASLHLVGDMELDDDLNNLVAGARDVQLTVLEFRLPRLWPDVEDLFEVLRAPETDDGGRDPEHFPAWSAAGPEARTRLADRPAVNGVGPTLTKAPLTSASCGPECGCRS